MAKYTKSHMKKAVHLGNLVRMEHPSVGIVDPVQIANMYGSVSFEHVNNRCSFSTSRLYKEQDKLGIRVLLTTGDESDGVIARFLTAQSLGVFFLCMDFFNKESWGIREDGDIPEDSITTEDLYVANVFASAMLTPEEDFCQIFRCGIGDSKNLIMDELESTAQHFQIPIWACKMLAVFYNLIED